MNKVKNLIVVCDYAFTEGGAANVAIQSVVALSKYTDLNVYCFAGNGIPCDELVQAGIKIKTLGLPDLLNNNHKIKKLFDGIYNKTVYKKMKQYLSSFNPEETIVHIHTWTKVLTSAVFKACEDMDFDVALTLHDYFLTCPNGACLNHRKEMICEFKPLSVKCWACNCDSRNYFHKIWRCIRQIIQNRIIFHNQSINYVFISKFQKLQISRRTNKIKNKYYVKNLINVMNRVYVDSSLNDEYVYIGRISHEKGVHLFCEAIDNAKVKGVIIGDGPLKKPLTDKYANIEFLGWCNKEEIENRLTKARALIFPTLCYEGSPLTIPEVQAFGIPCIITDCSAATDDIVNEYNGEIVSPNVKSIVKSIENFKDDRYVKKLSLNTYENFDTNRISEEHYAIELQKIYELIKKG